MSQTTHHPHSSTVDPAEVERFSRIADEWWDPTGKFAPLHKFNPVRLGYVRQARGHGDYLLTTKLVSMGLSYLSNSGIVDIAQPLINRMAGGGAEPQGNAMRQQPQVQVQRQPLRGSQ